MCGVVWMCLEVNYYNELVCCLYLVIGYVDDICDLLILLLVECLCDVCV